MPRTPLLRFLARLAKDPKAPTNEKKISRRDFLAASGAAAATLAFPKIVFSNSQPRIAIVGGGVAGLNAALTLQDAGIASTVYESSERLGGRMYSNSDYWQNGHVTEWCGELIDSGHKTMAQLCKRFVLDLDDLKNDSVGEDTFKFFGEYYTPEEAYRDWRNGISRAVRADQNAASFPTLYNSYTAAGKALDEMSVYDWIESRVPRGHNSPFGALLDVAYNIEYGADTSDQSALNLVYLIGTASNFRIYGDSDERYHIRGGNQRLPLAMAKALVNPVQLGMRLSSIARKTDGTYSLAFSGGREVVADFVILAIPFAVLRNLDYSKAGFDDLKNTAIQELGRGRNGKLQLQFASRYWRNASPASTGLTFTDEGYQNTWEVTRMQSGNAGILVDYTGGKTTEGKKVSVPYATMSSDPNVKVDAQNFLGQLEKVLPGGEANWNGLATSSLPALDPNLNLAYSYWRVGQYTRIAGYEAVRQGNVFFAGEHCSIYYQGFMEGAVQEGERAANEILRTLSLASYRKS